MSNSSESYLEHLKDEIEDLYGLLDECKELIRYTSDLTEKYRLQQSIEKISFLIQGYTQKYEHSARKNLPSNIKRIKSSSKKLDKIRKILLNKFEKEIDLKFLAFDLGINWDELEGKTQTDKISSLLTTLQQQSRITELIDLAVLQRERRSRET
jgi:hypothetical protein